MGGLDEAPEVAGAAEGDGGGAFGVGGGAVRRVVEGVAAAGDGGGEAQAGPEGEAGVVQDAGVEFRDPAAGLRVEGGGLGGLRRVQRREGVRAGEEAAGRPAVVALGQSGDRAGDRGDDEAARGALVEPGQGQAGDAAGGDDPVVRRCGRVPVGAVGPEDGRLEAGLVQPGAGGGRQAVAAVEGGDVGRAGEAAEQGREVAGAGADLQHPVAGPDIERVEHVGQQARQGGGGRSRARPFERRARVGSGTQELVVTVENGHHARSVPSWVVAERRGHSGQLLGRDAGRPAFPATGEPIVAKAGTAGQGL